MQVDQYTPVWLISVLLSLALHEYAHAKLADSAGDPTPGIYGRVTVNPLAHLDPLGTILIVFMAFSGVGFGWGKPVPMDPRKMRNPKWDHFWAVLGGPLTNLILAIVGAIVIRILTMVGINSEFVLFSMVIFVITNIGLFVFNLIPLGPLDGMWIAGTFMPEPMRSRWTRFNLSIGQFLFILLILPITGQSVVSYVIGPVSRFIMEFLLSRAL